MIVGAQSVNILLGRTCTRAGQDLHKGRLLAAKIPVQSIGVPVLSKKFPVHIGIGGIRGWLAPPGVG